MTDEYIEAYIEAIVKIANHDRMKKFIEPNLIWHDNVKEWQVKRILYARGLLENESLCPFNLIISNRYSGLELGELTHKK